MIYSTGCPQKSPPLEITLACALLYLWEFNLILHVRRKYLQLPFIPEVFTV
jgi:hypothetical protein